MDSLRGAHGAFEGPLADDHDDDDAVHGHVPPEIGTDERRMQVRAYNYWASLLADRNFPHVEDLTPEQLPDFGPHGVLLDFSQGIDDPAVTFLGEKLADECGALGNPIRKLSDVPARSLLSRITDHYMQIIANQAPIGFEAEFVNQNGRTILYRGILLPFSSDDETIDFIFGVINWKELAEPQTADELLLEIGQSLDGAGAAASANGPLDDDGPDDWADGPGAPLSDLVAGSDRADALPVPSFGLDDPVETFARTVEQIRAPRDDDAADLVESLSPDDFDADRMGLADWLAAARDQAQQARSNEDRTRGALYEAIGRAHDFALAAAESPEEFAELVADAGLAMQQRAPMTPVVKLVFGADYDKTRVTEYAAALLHAQRIGLGRGELAAYLGRVEGGLKGVVAEERRFRRDQDARPAPVRKGPRKAIAGKLRALPAGSFADIAAEGAEFALVMVRRIGEGEVVVLGEVPEDNALIERAARKLAD